MSGNMCTIARETTILSNDCVRGVSEGLMKFHARREVVRDQQSGAIGMVISILLFSILYLGISFILTALYVRFRDDDILAIRYRKNFVLFPSFPVIIFFRLSLLPIRLLAWSARDFFEFLSGKPTYHRRKLDYYGRRQKLRRRKVSLDSALQMGKNISSKPPPRRIPVSDNDADLSAVPKAFSKY